MGVRASYLHGVLEIRVKHVRRLAPKDVLIEGADHGAQIIEVLDA